MYDKDSGSVTFDYRQEIFIGDYYEEVGVYSFDATDILGAMETDKLPEPEDLAEFGDKIVVDAIEAGIIEDSGPFTALGGPDYESYLADRQSGELQPDQAACERKLLDMKVDHETELLNECQAKLDALETRIAELERKQDKPELDGCRSLCEAMDKALGDKGWDVEVNDDKTVEVEAYTSDTDACILLMLDFRDKDIESPDDWRSEVTDIVEDWDPFEEMECRRGMNGAPDPARILDDFRDFKDNDLKELADTVESVASVWEERGANESLDEMCEAKSAEAEIGDSPDSRQVENERE